MNLKPLGDRVLIKPLAQPTETDSGILIAEGKKPDEIGTVVAVGFARHPRKEEAEQHAQFVLDQCECHLIARGITIEPTAELLRDLVRVEPIVKVGDTVLFSWASGQELTLNDGDERYLLMKEADLLAVYEDKDTNG